MLTASTPFDAPAAEARDTKPIKQQKHNHFIKDRFNIDACALHDGLC
jgi:hypothetical protein